MAYQNVLFDWDGVFVQTPGIWMESIATAALEYGMNLTDSQVRMQAVDFEQALRHGLPERFYKSYSKRVRELAMPKVVQAPLYDGVSEMLTELKLNGMKLAILSSNWDAVEQVERKGVTHFFEFILSGRDVTKSKPDPEGVLKALVMLRADKGNTAFVGDAWTDLRAAANAEVPQYYTILRGTPSSTTLKS